MSSNIAAKLDRLGIKLPTAAGAVATYLPYKTTNNLVFISGQLPMLEGKIKYTGKVGQEYDLSTGQAAARLCGLNVLAQLNKACNEDLDQVEHCIKLGGFVNCTADFTDHPQVINAASDLIVEIFGDSGRHARAAVGVNSLPLDATVEVEAVFSLRG